MTQHPRAFLFLQGPPGPFFAELAAGLEDLGHTCRRVNFNGGDRHDWRRPAFDFAEPAEAWPARVTDLMLRWGISDIVLFGDCRPLHRIAGAAADRLGVAVHVFEEGYIRPDWVTLERGGVNGYSRLPRDPKEYLRAAVGLPPVPAYPSVPSSFRVRAREAIGYFFASWRQSRAFPGYRSHRPHALTAEAAGWLVRMALRPLARMRAVWSLRHLGRSRYFVLPLQLDSDHQIRTHSPFAGMQEAVETIVGSFGRHAPPRTKLVVKEHPLDNGLRPWRRIMTRIARWYCLGRRVIFLEHGDLEALVAGAEGVVTVNSTSGTLALAAGRPVAVLGQAVYDLAGVTDQGSLDAFWSRPVPPQPEIFEAFRRVLVARCLLRGGFSSTAGRALLVPAAVARLSASQVSSAAPTVVTAGAAE